MHLFFSASNSAILLSSSVSVSRLIRALSCVIKYHKNLALPASTWELTAVKDTSLPGELPFWTLRNHLCFYCLHEAAGKRLHTHSPHAIYKWTLYVDITAISNYASTLPFSLVWLFYPSAHLSQPWPLSPSSAAAATEWVQHPAQEDITQSLKAHSTTVTACNPCN